MTWFVSAVLFSNRKRNPPKNRSHSMSKEFKASCADFFCATRAPRGPHCEKRDFVKSIILLLSRLNMSSARFRVCQLLLRFIFLDLPLLFVKPQTTRLPEDKVRRQTRDCSTANECLLVNCVVIQKEQQPLFNEMS